MTVLYTVKSSWQGAVDLLLLAEKKQEFPVPKVHERVPISFMDFFLLFLR